ncbi:hypothetical protein EYF80_063942 [Liparis tanakae]|uniref:Uncharacterized protein n=1 Tax=Liparis tanakae TaxID=230148 RepID=A0A4Z2EC92_9TELE|nr:hypothetical protein EYF80_063942 [Liparis tanakae]
MRISSPGEELPVPATQPPPDPRGSGNQRRQSSSVSHTDTDTTLQAFYTRGEGVRSEEDEDAMKVAGVHSGS